MTNVSYSVQETKTSTQPGTLYRSLVIVAIFLTVILSFSLNSHAQNIPTRINNYKNSVNTSITTKTGPSSVTRTDVANSCSNLADLLKVVYDTMKATSGNLQTVTTGGNSTTNKILLKNGTNTVITLDPISGSVLSNTPANDQSVGINAGVSGSITPNVYFQIGAGTLKLQPPSVLSGSSVQTFKDESGTIPTLENANTWSGQQSFSSGKFRLNGASSGAVTISAAATTTAYSLTMPATQGGANTYLRNDGSGNLTWGPLSGGAPNLAAVMAVGGTTSSDFISLNKSILVNDAVGTSRTIIQAGRITVTSSSGTSAVSLRNLGDGETNNYLEFSSPSFSTRVYAVQPTALRVITIPDRDGTLVVSNAYSNVASTTTLSSAWRSFKLSNLTTSNGSITMPAASTGDMIKIWNQNTSGTFSWSFAGGNVKDAAGSTITNMANQTWYILEFDGTNWNKQN